MKGKLLITQGLHLLENKDAKDLVSTKTRTPLGRIFEMASKIVKNKVEDLWVLVEDVTYRLELFGMLMRNWGWHQGTLFVYRFSHRSVLSFALKSVNKGFLVISLIH